MSFKIKSVLLPLIFLSLCLPVFSQEASTAESIDQTTTEGSADIAATNPTPNELGLQTQIYRRIGQDTNTPQLLSNLGAMKSYRLTPGDVYRLSIKGGDLTSISAGDPTHYDIQMLEDYTIELPLIGSISCRGKNFPQLQKEVISKIKSTFSVFYVNFTFGAPAQFNSFIYGAVTNPGRIPCTPITTLAQAISAQGGFVPNASYRQIELRRNGEVLIMDLSRFYTYADESQNPYLQPGDIIFIPMAKKVVNIAGKVRNTGVYELLEEESVFDLISYAGGLASDASTESLELERTVGYTGERLYINHPIDEAKDLFPLNGDKVYIRSVNENSSMLLVDGAVYGQRHARLYPEAAPALPVRVNLPFHSGATVLSVLDSVGGPTPFALTDQAFIKRRGSLNKEPFDLLNLWESRDPMLDVHLQPGDVVVVPMQMLKVFVGGEVNSPGGFSFSHSLRPIDYIMQAGGYRDNADMRKLYKVNIEGKPERIEMTTKLEPGDILYIKKNHATEAAKILQNITVYTNFLNTIMGTMNGVIYFDRQLRESGVIQR